MMDIQTLLQQLNSGNPQYSGGMPMQPQSRPMYPQQSGLGVQRGGLGQIFNFYRNFNTPQHPGMASTNPFMQPAIDPAPPWREQPTFKPGMGNPFMRPDWFSQNKQFGTTPDMASTNPGMASTNPFMQPFIDPAPPWRGQPTLDPDMANLNKQLDWVSRNTQFGTTPGMASTTPGMASTTPGMASTTPGMASTTPGMASTNPGMASTTPGMASTNPGMALTNPSMQPSMHPSAYK